MLFKVPELRSVSWLGFRICALELEDSAFYIGSLSCRLGALSIGPKSTVAVPQYEANTKAWR